MAEVVFTVFAPIADEAEMIAMSVFEGQAQANFAGRAEIAPGGGDAPTHCAASGPMDETIKALYVADPRCKVSDYYGRNISMAFAECGMVPWNG